MNEKTKQRLLFLVLLLLLTLLLVQMYVSGALNIRALSTKVSTTEAALFDECIESTWCKLQVDEFIARHTDLKWVTSATSKGNWGIDCGNFTYKRNYIVVTVYCENMGQKLILKVEDIYPNVEMPNLPREQDPNWLTG